VIDYFHFSPYVLATLISESHTTQDVVRALEKPERRPSTSTVPPLA